jgi:hypothetical protein
LEDHDDDDGDEETVFPVPHESGVVIRALVDCVMLQSRMDNKEPRKHLLYSIYSWRRRMGELIRCASFLGFEHIQSLCDESMRERSSIQSWRYDIGMMLKNETFVSNDLVQFFAKKLAYDRIDENQLSQWVSHHVMDSWWYESTVEKKAFLYRRMRELLKWDGLAVYGRVSSDRVVEFNNYVPCSLSQYLFANGYTEVVTRHKLISEFLEFGVDILYGLQGIGPKDMSRLIYLLQTVPEALQARLLMNLKDSSTSWHAGRYRTNSVLTDAYWHDVQHNKPQVAPLENYISGKYAIEQGEALSTLVSESTNKLITKVADAFGMREDIFRCVFSFSF